MVFNDEEMVFMIAHVARDVACASDGNAKSGARMQKLLTDLAGVASNPAKPKKREAVRSKLKEMRSNPVQQQRRRDQVKTVSQRHYPIKNKEKAELRAVERDVHHEQLAASGKVARDKTEVRVSRPARVDVQV
jgi:hypothetical protein